MLVKQVADMPMQPFGLKGRFPFVKVRAKEPDRSLRPRLIP